MESTVGIGPTITGFAIPPLADWVDAQNLENFFYRWFDLQG